MLEHVYVHTCTYMHIHTCKIEDELGTHVNEILLYRLMFFHLYVDNAIENTANSSFSLWESMDLILNFF